MNETFANQFQNQTCEKPEVYLDAIQRRMYIVGTLSEEGNISFAAHPVLHPTKALALAESKRLALLKPGTAYIVVRFSGGTLVPKVISGYDL